MAITYNAGTNTITVTGYTEATPCNFTDVYNADVAGGWGVVSKLGSNFFKIDARRLVIGDGSTTTYFKSIKEAILFTITGTDWVSGNLEILNVGYLQFGNLTNNIPCDGCFILYDHSTRRNFIYTNSSGGYLKIYDTKIEAINSKSDIYPGKSHIDIRLSNFNNLARFDFDNSDTIIKDFVNNGCVYGGHIITSPATFFDNYKTFGGDPGGTDRGITFMKDATIKNFYFDPNVAISIRPQYAGTNAIVVDGDFDFTTVACHLTADLIAKYSFDLKVIDKNEVGISGASVKIWDKDNNLVTDTTTNASGVITTQELNYGRWVLVGAVTTLTLQTPHLIKIEKAGYTTYEADFTLEDKTDWLIALQTSILRNPSMGGGMV